MPPRNTFSVRRPPLTRNLATPCSGIGATVPPANPAGAGSQVLEVMGSKMVEREFDAGVEARLHHKDYAAVIAEAHRLGVPLPVSGQVGQQLNALMAMGWGSCDTATLLQVLEAGRRNK